MVSFFSKVYYFVTDSIFPPDSPGEQWRDRARAEATLRASLLQQSQQAFREGRKNEAKLLSNKGQEHGANVESFNARAAETIFNHNNNVLLPQKALKKVSRRPRQIQASGSSSELDEVDLHGLFVAEALSYAEAHITKCQRKKIPRTVFITGRGNRSQDGVAKIRPAIINLLNRKRITVATDPTNDGVVIAIFDSIPPSQEESGWGCIVM